MPYHAVLHHETHLKNRINTYFFKKTHLTQHQNPDKMRVKIAGVMCMANKYSGVSQLPNGAWYYRIKLILPNGEKIDTTSKKSDKGTPYLTAKEAYEAKIAHETRLKSDPTKQKREKTTLEDVNNDYLKTLAREKAPSTLRKQNSMWRNHIYPAFGKKDINKITLADLQNFLSVLYLDKQYSYKYTEGFLKYFYLLFGHAYRMERIDPVLYNKMFIDKGTRLTMPKMTQEDAIEDEEPAEIYSDYILRQLEEVFSGEYELYKDDEKDNTGHKHSPHNKGDSNLLTAFYLGLYAGLRVSEVFALRWRDIDWSEQTLNIHAQMQYENGTFCLMPVKTLTSVRKVIISKPLHDHLLNLYHEQKAQREKLGNGYRNTEIVEDRTTRKVEIIKGGDFINRKKNGELLTVNSVKYYAKKIRQELGIEFKFHNLRHTFASTCAINNMNIQILMQQMGHKKIDTTRKYYINLNNEELKRKTKALMDTMFDFQPKEITNEAGEVVGIIVPDTIRNEHIKRRLKHTPR